MISTSSNDLLPPQIGIRVVDKHRAFRWFVSASVHIDLLQKIGENIDVPFNEAALLP
jgi:hypothetical protein